MPGYQALYREGELGERAVRALGMLERCHLCPRACGVNRLRGERGECRTGREAVVCSYGAHFGEEAPLVGRHGSGTIFFSNCNLGCVFCQNYEISQMGEGQSTDKERLALVMLRLQDKGCHNINLVSPSHVTPQILEALEIACARGLSVPLVYNCGGYESLQTLRLLDGVVDIYMPDMKYSDEAVAERLSGVKHYPRVNRLAVREMHRQVGDLKVDNDGIATRGLLVRHLVLPEGLAGTDGVAGFLADEVSANTYLNVMSQYRPCYKAYDFPGLGRSITAGEFTEAVAAARRHGLRRLDGVESLAAARLV